MGKLTPKAKEYIQLNKTFSLSKLQSKLVEIYDIQVSREAIRKYRLSLVSTPKVVKKVVTKGNNYRETVTPKSLERFLGIPRFRRSEIDKVDEVGVAIGMAWTEFGGELLTFEVTKVHGKGIFTLTGQLGEIMQESAQTAFSYVRGKMYELDVTQDLHKNFDIHVHVPEGATPKEGPSAGITLATSIISLLTGIPVTKKVALTGEITLKG